MSSAAVLTAAWSFGEEMSEAEAYVRAVAALFSMQADVSVLATAGGPFGVLADGAFDVEVLPAPTGRPSTAALLEELASEQDGYSGRAFGPRSRLGSVVAERARSLAAPQSPAAVSRLAELAPDVLVVAAGAETTAEAYLARRRSRSFAPARATDRATDRAADRAVLPEVVYVPLLNERGPGPGGLSLSLLGEAAAVLVASSYEEGLVRRYAGGRDVATVVTGTPKRTRVVGSASRSIWAVADPFFLVLERWPALRSTLPGRLADHLCAELASEATFLLASGDRIDVVSGGRRWQPAHVPAESDVARLMASARAVVDLREPAHYEGELAQAVSCGVPMVLPTGGYRGELARSYGAALWFSGPAELVECVRLLIDEGTAQALRSQAVPPEKLGPRWPGRLADVLGRCLSAAP